ncbi:MULTISPECIES: cell wall protein [Streptomyces]|uniref:Cell wall protein n=1 Tax=Streptomyces lonegramiae TaxID=3075524 RepID=A0ABU2XGA2_9ACTN|nr:cell wall protein [Streptomyces sp. DSM 41529]MDT0544969.1 cell wall protein [Streptomyces sp. DSM 41529]
MTSPRPAPGGLEDVGRRRFLTTVALSGATIVGATSLGAVDADAAFAAPLTPLDPAVPRSAFVEGRILRIDGSVLWVAGSHGDAARVRLTNATSVWKAGVATAEAIEAGDGLYARGVPMPDGTVAADAVWVNIVNLYATVRRIDKDRLHLTHGAHRIVGHLLPVTTSASYPGTAATSDLSRLRVGDGAQVLGAWRPADRAVDVVRVSVGPPPGRRR